MFSGQMIETVRERALWLARNILPHEPAIRAWLGGKRIDGLDVDDIIQEMYAKIVALESLEVIRFPKRYAFQTASSIVIDHIRRARIVSIFSAGTLEQFDLPALDATPEQHLTFQEEIKEVVEALSKLPKSCREALILRRVEGLSQRETAKRLGISEHTVEKYMARGTLMLMNQFGRGGKIRFRPSKESVVSDTDNGREKYEPRD
jgi:RNA polymerase sigma-70 factor (ECF subfamily)